MNHTVILALAASSLLTLLLGAAAFFMFRMMRASAPQKDESLSLLQQQMESLRAQLSTSLIETQKLTQQQLSSLTSQMTQNAQSTTTQINSRLDSYSKVVQSVSEKLGSLSQATERIFEATKNISTLEEILKPPKLRGGMGEIMLENILREILPSADFFSLQHAFKSGDRVDAVIRLKDGLIPVDAKFPLDNFRRMIESKEDKEKETLRKEFVKNVKKHIDDISRKYILPDEGTFNFALMYIPAENVYYETIIRYEGQAGDLYSYAAERHVFPVSPNSLYPYLMTLALGFRGLKIEKQAREILSELARLQGDLGKFSEDFRLVGKHLADAGKNYADAEKRLDRMDQKLSSLKEGTTAPTELNLL